MLNKKWGAQYDNAYNLSPLTFAGFKNSQTTFYYNSNNTPTASNIASRWHAQIGFRLIF
jgi:virulence-associated protein VapD